MKTKSKYRNFLFQLQHEFPIFLSAVAVLVISWNVLSSFDRITSWWALPSLAILTGVAAILLPKIAAKFKKCYAIMASGIALLFINLCIFIQKDYRFFAICVIIFAIGLLTDFLVSLRVSIGDVLFDLVVSTVGAAIINFFLITLLTILLLVVVFVIILSFKFSYKDTINKKDNSKKTDSNAISEK